MITMSEVITKLKSGKSVELMFFLVGSIFSRHTLYMKHGLVYDFSYVDGETTIWMIKSYRNSFYKKAFKQGLVELSEEYE